MDRQNGFMAQAIARATGAKPAAAAETAKPAAADQDLAKVANRTAKKGSASGAVC